MVGAPANLPEIGRHTDELESGFSATTVLDEDIPGDDKLDMLLVELFAVFLNIVCADL